MGRDAGGRALRRRDALLLTRRHLPHGGGSRRAADGGWPQTAACFSPTYAVARRRFRQAARDAGSAVEEFPFPGRGPDGEALAVDVATVGAARPARAVVVSSGLHGVEGFFGSAVQVAWLEGVDAGRIDVPPGTAVVLVHAVNPYGFAWRRRANVRISEDVERRIRRKLNADSGMLNARFGDVERRIRDVERPFRAIVNARR